MTKTWMIVADTLVAAGAAVTDDKEWLALIRAVVSDLRANSRLRARDVDGFLMRVFDGDVPPSMLDLLPD